MRNHLTRLATCVVLLAVSSTSAWAADEDVEIVRDCVYGHKDGMALTYDVLKPAKPNGAGVLYIQSGGWYSGWRPAEQQVGGARALLDRGFTAFIVYHGSAPRYTVPEAAADVHRAARHIHLRADKYGVDPKRLGAVGGSAGGHLTLVLATTGDDGDPKAQDEVLRASSRLAAAVAFFPPTDIRGWPTDPPAAIKENPGLKPPLSFDPALAAGISPVLHASAQTPPTLLIHGDKDPLVPIEHSHNMLKALDAAGAKCRLLTIEGATHNFTAAENGKAVPVLVEWFVSNLAPPAETK